MLLDYRISSDFGEWDAFVSVVRAHPRANPDVFDPMMCGAVLAGQGLTSDVWVRGNKALKAFRIWPQGSLDVPQLMRNEVETYVVLENGDQPSPLPPFYAFKEFSAKNEGELCGAMLFGRVEGKPLSLAELGGLPDERLNVWLDQTVDQIVGMDDALNAVRNPPSFWDVNYAQPRVQNILHVMPDVHQEDKDIAVELDKFIIKEIGGRSFGYLNGDVNPPNIMCDVDNNYAVRFIDPLINKGDAHESKARQLAQVPGLAQHFAFNWNDKTGYEFNFPLMWGYAAMTAHYMGLVLRQSNPEESVHRFIARDAFMKRSGIEFRPTLKASQHYVPT